MKELLSITSYFNRGIKWIQGGKLLSLQSGTRNQNIEFLRVLMMLLIVTMHISGHSVDLDVIRTGRDPYSYWILSYRSVTYLGVPTFAFISGYYGISFKLKKLINMEIMAITYGIIVILICLFFHIDNKINNYISLLFPASSGFLWYYSSYIYLFLFCSFINIVIEKINQKEIFYAFVFFIVAVYLLRSNIFGKTNDFLMLFVIYMVGRYLKTYPIKIIEKNCKVLFFTTQLLNVFLFIIFARLGLSKVVAILEGTNILTFISAICLFYVFLRKKRTSYMEKIIARLAPYMLAVYIIHASLLRCNVLNLYSLEGSIIKVFFVSIIILLSASFVEMFRSFLMRKIGF